MPQRIDAGPALAALGAVLLVVSLFLAWFTVGGADVTGWGVFEAVDLLLFALALAAGWLALDRLGSSAPRDGRLLPGLGAAALFVVAVQLLDPPPAVANARPDLGAWLALAGSALVLAGGVLAAAAISVTVTVAGRDARRRVPAVDRRRRAAAEEDVAPGGDDEEPPAAPRTRRAATLLGDDDERTEAFRVADLAPRRSGRRREGGAVADGDGGEHGAGGRGGASPPA